MSSQSPIKLKIESSIEIAQPHDLLTIHYPATQSFVGKFDGNASSHGNFELGGTKPKIVYRGRKYKLVKIHIHELSEHVVEGDSPSQFEVHFVHIPVHGDGSDPKVVLGVLYKECEQADRLCGDEAIIAPLGHEDGCSTDKDASGPTHSVTPARFFPRLSDSSEPDFDSWYYYEGSLTSYPYSEDVSWFVMKNEAVVHPDETRAFKRCSQQHARGLQPLERRLVLRSFGE
ncbi:carbonic anhydrase family protein [Blastopirellula sp. J2-11]|uniref:carbonic anhydrase family protein n=1 Tax=Blastopirellula sp. J2-11 TaxID=2943192 RepID=UPI0021CA5B66|nr:carbonic anhydrase family protein [Blastopirellula sp. J2-11]UUO06146.1 carbonic anhydrase family protein [Blastopirellula sp. J2-11]